MKKMICTLAFLCLASGSALATDKTLIYCSEGDPDAFNPQVSLSGTSAIATSSTIYDRLLQFSYGGTQVLPALAERWEVSSDQKVYTFHLRRDVTFHTTAYFAPTRPMNAEDVVFSIDRQLLASHPFHKVGGGTYQYFQGMGMDHLIDRVTALDASTVQIHLHRPEAPFLANLAMHFMSILSKEYADQLQAHGRLADIDVKPIGTGPFAFYSYQRGSTIRYRAHESYWQGRPKLAQLVFAITPDPTVRYQKLKKGECHIAVYPAPADLQAIEAHPKLRLEHVAGLNFGYLAMNNEKQPYDNVLVRRAVAHALNKPSYVRAIYQGKAVPAKNPMPPTIWSYDDGIEDYGYNPTQARALLAEAGLPDGFDTVLWTLPVTRPFNPNGKKLGEMMQRDLAAVGIRAQLRTFDWATYLQKTLAGEQEIEQLGWTGDNGDPDNFLYTLFSCDSVTRGSNNSRFCNADFDRALIDARTTNNPEEREALYRRAQAIFHEHIPVVPVIHALVYRALSERVLGYKMDPFDQERFFMLDLQCVP